MQLMTDSLSSESPPRSLDRSTCKNKLKHSLRPDDEKKEHARQVFRIFVYNKEHDQTVAVTLRNRNTKIQSILTSIVQRKVGWAKDRYFLINVKDEQILNPERTLSHYHIANESVFILTRKNFRSHAHGSLRSGALSANHKKAKLTIICSFGAPYDKQKLISSYFGDASLNQYAFKIKDKFGMARGTVITFRSVGGVPFLGKHRKCGLKQLGLHADDEVLAQTNGINLTLAPFHAPGDAKVVEMFRGFSLSMLRDQIKKELRIGAKQQRWLIRSGGRLVRTDEDCADIAEHETITVLSGCRCKRAHSNSRTAHTQSDNHCLAHMGAGARASSATSVLPVQLPHPATLQAAPSMMTMPSPAAQSPLFVMAPKYPQFAQSSAVPVSPLYPKWAPAAPLMFGNSLKDQKDFDAAADTLSVRWTVSPRLDRALKPCRHGRRCRFHLNPQISGPCHFYHPPSAPANINVTVKPSGAAKRRKRRNRAKHY